VGFLTLVSAGIRLTIVAGAPFPINDGGLFYAFTTDLLANGLRLPSFASYNGAGIPLVYPPLAFYATAVLHQITGISVPRILQFVPAIASAVAIPAFYALAAKMMQSRQQAALATLVFSLVPRSFDWLIMGGGITRSLGLLFFLLFLLQAFRLFAEQDQRAVWPAVLAGGLVVVSHPEAAVHAAVAAGLLLGWHGRTRTGLVHALLVVLGIAILTSPWWLAIAVRHGPGPWLAGLAAAHDDSYAPLLRLAALLRFDFTDEPFLRILGVLGLLGLFVHIARREYFLLAWLTLMEVAEPRGGALFIMIPLAMAAGYFLDRVLLPALQHQEAQTGGHARRSLPTAADMPVGFQTSRLPFVVLTFLFLYGVLAAYFVGRNLQQNASLARRDLLALGWITSHTDADARFALVTQGQPLLDPTSDWFPAITGRRSVASYFGAEWIRGLDFARGLASYRALQACADQDAQCLKVWQGSGIEAVGYVYVRAPNPERRTLLQESLRLDHGFRLVYSEQGIDVFQWRALGGD
jgi:hypothetical protein